MLFFVAGSEIEFAAFRGRTGPARRSAGSSASPSGSGSAWLFAPGRGGRSSSASRCARRRSARSCRSCATPASCRTPFGQRDRRDRRRRRVRPAHRDLDLPRRPRPGPLDDRARAVRGCSRGSRSGWRSGCRAARCTAFVNSTLHTSGQFAIRVVFLILAALIALSIVLDLDMLLGAFTAGIIWRLLMRDAAEPDREAVESKVEAVAFGFLVPVFFIYTGVTFDLEALLAQPILFLLRPGRARRAVPRPRPPVDARRARRVDAGATGSRSRCSGRRRCRSSSRSPRSASTRASSRPPRGRARRRRHAVGAAVPAHRDEPPR